MTAHTRDKPPEYAELHCLSNFSFLRGASHPHELVTQAARLGYRALAITDECSLAGVVRAHVAAGPLGIKLVIGSEFRLDDGTRLILLAANRQGYGQLCTLITRGRRNAGKGSYHLSRGDFCFDTQHLLTLWLPGEAPESEHGCWMRDAFPGRSWIAVELFLTGHDRKRLMILQDLGRQLGLPLVASGDVHMHSRNRRVLQDVLTAVRLRRPLTQIQGELYPNGERHLRTRTCLASHYPPELLHETLVIADRCTFSLNELRYEYPEEIVPPGKTAPGYLRELVYAGAMQRWPAGTPTRARTQIEHELNLIGELRYEPYFLTVHDIVKFAHERGILCQGRGSAANSAVCYCLGITELDPARMNLLFERFMSKEREEPPDIDVDFEHQRREEVIQYIYNKYGRERAAITATLITYQLRSAVRDVGKALGLGRLQADRLAASFQRSDDAGVRERNIAEAGFDAKSPVMRQLAILVGTLIGFPRHLSQHVGGFVVSRGPLCQLVPIENASMTDRTVIQWDKNDLDAIGLLKVDVLALGILSAIRRTLESVSRIRGHEITLASIPAEDQAVYRMIQQADTIGVFQIESRAQMAMLPRLKPTTFYDLAIEIALIRPGPIQGDMVHPYLARRKGLEPVTYPSAAVEEVLSRTLGVPIFQEQVMRLAVVAAGFTAGEADQLRRAMAAWRHTGNLGAFEQKLLAGMRERGYPETFAKQIYKQIRGFGEYGFPESHAASFAMLAYVSAWLKFHEPAAFTCALLNSQPMGFYAPAQLIQDARHHGVEVRPVDVNLSEWDCALEHREGQTQPALRLGFRMVRGLFGSVARHIVAARSTGRISSVEDVAHRTKMDRADIRRLAAAGALQSLAGHRYKAHWVALGMERAPDLGEMPVHEATPLLGAPTEWEDIVADYAVTGFTLRRHPLALLRGQLNQKHVLQAIELLDLSNGATVHVAGLVTHRQRPGSAKGVTFMTLEDDTGHVNVIIWPALAGRQRNALMNAQLMGVKGVIQRDGDVVHLIASCLIRYDHLLGALPHRSRDFR